MSKSKGFDSMLESRFDTHLRLLKKARQIRDYVYHPDKLTICSVPVTKYSKKKGWHISTETSTYTPDFAVTMLDGSVVMVETKGYFYEKDKHRVRGAAFANPQYIFQIIKEGKDGKFFLDKEYNRTKIDPQERSLI